MDIRPPEHLRELRVEPRGLRLISVFLFFVAASANIWAEAQDRQQIDKSLAELTLEQLGHVEVTAVRKEPEQVWRTPAAIYVITQEDIRRSGATSIPEVLRLAPGVEVAQIDSSTWAVGIRGFGNGFSKSVLVLIDGRNVYTPLFAGVNWKLQNVMLEDVERIEVIRGPGGTIWGTNAVNGVINIITKNSRDSRGAHISVGGGNIHQGMGTFRYGGSAGANLSYRIYGMAFGRGPQFHSDSHDFDSWQLGQGGFRLDWSNQSRDELTLQGDLYKGNVGQRQTIGSYSPPAALNVEDDQQVSGGNILGRWSHSFDRSDIEVQAYYDRTYRLGSQIGETRNTFDVDFIHHLTLLPRQDIIWGLGARWSPSDVVQTVPTVDFQPHHQSDDVYSAFVQDEVALLPERLWVTLGSKFEHNIYTGWEMQPSARILLRPSARQSLWAAVTRAVRSPSRLDEDLQLTTFFGTVSQLPAFVRAVGNPQFQSETLLGYEVGYRRLITPRLYVDIAAFHNHHDNLTSLGVLSIVTESTPPPLRLVGIIPWENGIEGSTSGIEITPDWKVTNWWELQGSYSYMNLDLRNKPGSTDASTVQNYEGSSPRNQVSVQSLFSLPGGFEFDPAYRYVGALPGQAFNLTPGAFVPAYSTMDVHFGWRLNPNFEFSITGRNLLQPHHPEFGGDPGPLVQVKRSVFARLTWRM